MISPAAISPAAARVARWSLLLCCSAACAAPQAGDQDSPEDATVAMSSSDESAGWRTLFDGTSTAAWRGFRSDSLPGGWQVVDGALTRVGRGGDIITRDRFRDFELELEWMVEPGGNSGIMYRVTEDANATYMTGPEMQVLDDAGHVDGGNRLTSAGALYGLYPAPAGVVKPAGQWNQARLVVDSGHVEHWLNGVKVAEAEMGSPEWNDKVANSKFAEWSGFGRAREGHIALQDHGDRVAYRNIRIRTLP